MSEVLQPIVSTVGKALGFEQAYTPEVYQPGMESFAPSEEEKQLTQALLARAQGKGGPSPAELQMQAALQQQAAQAQGLAAAQRGISPALAARQAQQAMAMAGQQTAQQQAQLRAQEALGAEQLAQQGLQSQRGGRMSYEQLRAQGSLGQEQMKQQAAEDQINRLTKTLTGISQTAASYVGMGGGGASAGGGGGAGAAKMLAHGGIVPDDIHNFAMAIGQHVGSMNMQKGGKVPGIAPIPKDSAANDIVPAMLSPGEIVIPRSIAKKSPEEVAQFIMALRGGM